MLSAFFDFSLFYALFRLANVVKSDKIYFLKDGEIKESGKHDELMSQNGAYRHLYESQMALENYGKGGMA